MCHAIPNCCIPRACVNLGSDNGIGIHMGLHRKGGCPLTIQPSENESRHEVYGERHTRNMKKVCKMYGACKVRRGAQIRTNTDLCEETSTQGHEMTAADTRRSRTYSTGMWQRKTLAHRERYAQNACLVSQQRYCCDVELSFFISVAGAPACHSTSHAYV